MEPPAERESRDCGDADVRREVTTAEALDILGAGDLEVVGRMPWSSNATFLARTADGSLAVYKPQRGERPLWDFPSGTLCRREVAAFLVSDAAGWAIVPPTILRDGPHGVGSLQLFVDHDPDEHYLNLCDDHADRFREFAAFDVIINNADRKAGHCLRARDGHIWGIDHGVTFHQAHKLRTVIWDFVGEPLPPAVCAALGRLIDALYGDLGDALLDVLDDGEVEATLRRAERLAAMGKFPPPRTDYPYPWPMV